MIDNHHINRRDHREVVKLLLRFYEMMTSTSLSMATYAGVPTEDDNSMPHPEFNIPRRSSFIKDDAPERLENVRELVQTIQQEPEQIAHLANELLASRAHGKKLVEIYNYLYNLKTSDFKVEQGARAFTENGSGLCFDLLTLVGKEDLHIKDLRKAKLSELLSPSFTAALKAAGNIQKCW